MIMEWYGDIFRTSSFVKWIHKSQCDCEPLLFLICSPEHTIDQTLEWLLFWDAIRPFDVSVMCLMGQIPYIYIYI